MRRFEFEINNDAQAIMEHCRMVADDYKQAQKILDEHQKKCKHCQNTKRKGYVVDNYVDNLLAMRDDEEMNSATIQSELHLSPSPADKGGQ